MHCSIEKVACLPCNKEEKKRKKEKKKKKKKKLNNLEGRNGRRLDHRQMQYIFADNREAILYVWK